MAPASAGFPPQKRLRASREFSRVFARPARASDRFFTVLARPNDVGTARLGLAISRKAAKRSVDRNRLKRIARETFRKHSLPALDFVILARPDAAQAAGPALAASLAAHFDKLSRTASPRGHDERPGRREQGPGSAATPGSAAAPGSAAGPRSDQTHG